MVGVADIGFPEELRSSELIRPFFLLFSPTVRGCVRVDCRAYVVDPVLLYLSLHPIFAYIRHLGVGIRELDVFFVMLIPLAIVPIDSFLVVS